MNRLAAVLTVSFVIVACSSFPDQVPAPEGEKKDQNAGSRENGAQLPPSSTPKSGTTTTDASTPTETSPPASSDAGTTSDAAAPKGDAGTSTGTKDASTSTPKIGFGQPCTSHTQCADGLCLPFDGKGLRCTKTCNDDDDCPSDDCDGDTVKVCDID